MTDKSISFPESNDPDANAEQLMPTDCFGAAETSLLQHADREDLHSAEARSPMQTFSARWAQKERPMEVLEAAIRECDEARTSGSGKLFDRMLHQAVLGMRPAYPLYLALLAGGSEALKRTAQHPIFAKRSRGLLKGSEATVAAKIVLEPEPGDEKACSDYAALLIYAAGHSVLPEEFVEALQSVNFKVCRAYAASVRGRKRKTVLAKKGDEPKLELAVTFFDANGERRARHWDVDETRAQAILSSMLAGSEADRDLLDAITAVIAP